ncbi:MAG: hypothetical protein ACO24O_08640, partial [Arenimonas sp.]
MKVLPGQRFQGRIDFFRLLSPLPELLFQLPTRMFAPYQQAHGLLVGGKIRGFPPHQASISSIG